MSSSICDNPSFYISVSTPRNTPKIYSIGITPQKFKPMVSITSDYISVGGNRHPAAADWDVQSGVLAFGADNNVALWDPKVRIIA